MRDDVRLWNIAFVICELLLVLDFCVNNLCVCLVSKRFLAIKRNLTYTMRQQSKPQNYHKCMVAILQAFLLKRTRVAGAVVTMRNLLAGSCEALNIVIVGQRLRSICIGTESISSSERISTWLTFGGPGGGAMCFQ